MEHNASNNEGTCSSGSSRRIREEYRKLLTATQIEDQPDVNKLKEVLNEAGKLFHNVRDDMSKEATLDAKLMRQLSIAGLRKVESLHTNMVSFEPLDFMEKTMKFLSTSDGRHVSADDLKLFGEKMNGLYRRSPTFNFMLGTFARTAPERKTRAPRAKADKESKPEKATAPKTVKEMGKSDQELTSEEVERVLNVLRAIHSKRAGGPIRYYEFICDPTSFSQTVQNIFHTSFLIKDGYARIFPNDSGSLMIEPIEIHDTEDRTQRINTSANAAIVSITQAGWKKMLLDFRVKRPLIPSPALSGK